MTTFYEATQLFLIHCKHEKGLSKNTLKFYEIDLKQFNGFINGEFNGLNLEEIDRDVLRMYLQTLSKFQPKTIKRKIATLKALFNLFEFEDKLESNPFRKIKLKIKEPKILPKVMNIQEIKKIFNAVYFSNKKQNEFTNSSQETIRNIAVIELLFATGIRVSELVSLKNEDIDLRTGIFKVCGKGSKERILQVCNAEALQALKNYYSKYKSKINDSGGVFFINRVGKNLSDQSVRRIVKKTAQKASINRRITPHMFRHTFATLLLENDVDIKYIQSFLGHSSILTTQIYTNVANKKQKQILSTKHPRKDFKMKSS